MNTLDGVARFSAAWWDGAIRIQLGREFLENAVQWPSVASLDGAIQRIAELLASMRTPPADVSGLAAQVVTICETRGAAPGAVGVVVDSVRALMANVCPAPRAQPTPPMLPHYAAAARLHAEAGGLVTGDRAAQHGDFIQNFANIARLWDAYLAARSGPLSPRDVAQMMVLLKIARTGSGQHNEDNFRDAIGYAMCAAGIACTEDRT